MSDKITIIKDKDGYVIGYATNVEADEDGFTADRLVVSSREYEALTKEDE